MNLDLRQAIIGRLNGRSTEELQEVIEGSIGNGERTLPGLGVIFEIIWQHSEKEAQDQMVNTLMNHLPEHAKH
jgi:small, acid-soluble spore protein I